MSFDIPTQHIIVMGVAASGKTTIGSLVAERLAWTFFDADDFHPDENVEKLRTGVALDDDDRKPWLLALQQHLVHMSERGISSVLACSALKASYRDMLTLPFAGGTGDGDGFDAGDGGRVSFGAGLHTHTHVSFLVLDLPFAVAKKRIKKRQREYEHFMNPKLLQDQFDTLEMPTAEQYAEGAPIRYYRIDASSSNIDGIVESCIREISR